jgi:hypothetical protein
MVEATSESLRAAVHFIDAGAGSGLPRITECLIWD